MVYAYASGAYGLTALRVQVPPSTPTLQQSPAPRSFSEVGSHPHRTFIIAQCAYIPYHRHMKHEHIKSYIAVFEEEIDGEYSVSVPALQGCFSQGDTFEESRKNIEEAIRLYLENADEETQNHIKSRLSEVVRI